jgi:ABC-type transporter Mla maintaining outer membrane lipid asymmetry ATPase subunit MlaF
MNQGDGGGAAIVVDGLTKRFGDRIAVDGVPFTVGFGEVFGVLGPERRGPDDDRADAGHADRTDGYER